MTNEGDDRVIDHCDFPHEKPTPATDCHAGEVFYCEEHRPLVLTAWRAGILDRENYTLADVIEAGIASE